ncbi:histidine kinase [Thioflavicoccus mobilis 8321]|uniref:histidine kinase n=1 Tax=Thioflavicoccus mobilis 8321 TaxID=765912 RepID=L0GW13_9GAMM|nr:sensor histidine kinase [Thioflavicoccus mobilis]AGA90181.1 histidine kinase [Thioflavicoccus mobilis 8321]
MQKPPSPNPVRTALADALEREADAIVREWLDCLRARVGTRTIFALPEKALENHIPPVLQSLGAFVRLPIEAVRAETIGHLRMHALIRKQQGYDVQELMLEFDYLAEIVTSRLLAELETAGLDGHLKEVAQAFNLLNSGLRAMGFVTVGVYWEKEEEMQGALSRRLKEFGDMLAHEIRQPLQAASVSVEMLREERVRADAEQCKRYLDVIDNNLTSTGQLVDSICLLAAAESARSDQDYLPLATIVERVFEQLAPMAEDRGVALILDPELPEVELLPLSIHLALLNFVSNAIKYRDAAKPEPWVRIAADWRPKTADIGACIVRVADNGVGIPIEARDHIFQRHFRAHPEIEEGLGLGLSIARHALQQNSGRVWLESEVGEGTTFFVEIEGRSMKAKGKPPGEASIDDALANSTNGDTDDD